MGKSRAKRKKSNKRRVEKRQRREQAEQAAQHVLTRQEIKKAAAPRP